MTNSAVPTWTSALTWGARAVAAAGVVVVLWCLVTAWPAVVHGHPAYAVVLVLTLVGSVLLGWRSLRPRPENATPPATWRTVLRIVLLVAAAGWIALVVWLRPFSALEPALAAMASDAKVTVAEYPTQIVMAPTAAPKPTGVFFQPGAKVEARAYAAVLRPLAEAGYTVVIPKQPLGIGFLATTAFESTQGAYPGITRWVVGGHSLGGTVAAMDAEAHDAGSGGSVVGLLLYASYPATDMSSSLSSRVLSISASEDGLATPAKIDASKSTLPRSTQYVVIDGAVHAFFGDYGPQPGDGTPTISHDAARTQISKDTLGFLASLDGAHSGG
jgi:hypothetical protein